MIRDFKLKEYLKDALSKHYEVMYTSKTEKVENDNIRITPASADLTLEFTDNHGKIKKSANITVNSYGTEMRAELLYSAWLGWREERRSNGKTTLNMDNHYESLLIEHGSWIEIPLNDSDVVRARLYNFSALDGRNFICDTDSDTIEYLGNIDYLITKVDLFHESVYNSDNIPVQTEEVIKISEDNWFKYHLGIKSIDNDWTDLIKSYGISEEARNELYHNWIVSMGYNYED